MKYHYSIDIQATPERVFHWLDDAQRVTQWVPNLVENEDLQVTDNRVGSTFHQVYVENGRRMEMDGVVTEYDANRRLTCEIKGKEFDLRVDYKLEDLSGRTRLTQDTDVRFKGFFRIVGGMAAPFIRRVAKKQLAESFAKLKSLSEAADEPSVPATPHGLTGDEGLTDDRVPDDRLPDEGVPSDDENQVADDDDLRHG